MWGLACVSVTGQGSKVAFTHQVFDGVVGVSEFGAAGSTDLADLVELVNSTAPGDFQGGGGLLKTGTFYANPDAEPGDLGEVMLCVSDEPNEDVKGTLVFVKVQDGLGVSVACRPPLIDGSWGSLSKGLAILRPEYGLVFLPKGGEKFVTVTPAGDIYSQDKHVMLISVSEEGALEVS